MQADWEGKGRLEVRGGGSWLSTWHRAYLYGNSASHKLLNL